MVETTGVATLATFVHIEMVALVFFLVRLVSLVSLVTFSIIVGLITFGILLVVPATRPTTRGVSMLGTAAGIVLGDSRAINDLSLLTAPL